MDVNAGSNGTLGNADAVRLSFGRAGDLTTAVHSKDHDCRDNTNFPNKWETMWGKLFDRSREAAKKHPERRVEPSTKPVARGKGRRHKHNGAY